MDNRSFESAASATPPSAPASPSSGYPTNGNPTLAIPATKPGDYWFYQIGEELRNVITGAGLTPAAGTLNQLYQAIQLLTGAVGTIAYVASSTAPTGYLKANGAAVSRTTYAALFAVIGTTYGAGDGSTTFNLPDGRGEFPRGWDDGRGVDAGRVLGSAQADELKTHTHNQSATTVQTGTSANLLGSATNSAALGGATGATGGSETRPRNIAWLCCIKY